MTPDPPHDLDAERATLGAVLSAADPNLVAQVLSLVNPVDFYDPRHQTVCAAIRSLHADGYPTDPIAVATHLSVQGSLARLGGAPYLVELMQSVPLVASGPYYAGIVHRLADTRARQVAAIRIGQVLASDDPDSDKNRQLLAELAQQVVNPAGPAAPTDTEINWATLIGTDFGQLRFLTEPLLQPGAQIGLIGDGKVGKSLFSLEWAIRLSAGLPFLRTVDNTEPITVGYIDQENSHPELQRRLWTLGFDDPATLQNLHYLSFPRFGPLDTPEGAGALVRWVLSRGVGVVFLDTISRMFAGPENDSDTWLQLYRLAMLPLKAEGVSVIRLDHFGKDRERGARGSSAKTQDVDHEWTMTAIGGGLTQLRRTYTRNGIGDGLVLLRRLGNPEEPGTTAHVVYTPPPGAFNPVEVVPQNEHGLPDNAGVAELVQLLDQLQVPVQMGRRAVVDLLRERRGVSARTRPLQEAINHRRERELYGQQAIDVGSADNTEDPHEEWADSDH